MTTSGRLIARNTLLNLAGQAVPFLIGLLAMPTIIRGLGTARFGLLGLAWVVVGYFSVLDLGMGRAATRFAADAIGRKAFSEIPGIAWSAVLVQAAVGAVGSVVLVAITPFLVSHVLHISPDLQNEARSTFRILALGIPIVLAAASFRGMLEASQRFDLVNLVSIPGSALNFLVPLAGSLAGWSLPDIISVLVLGRVVTMIGYFGLATRLFPDLAHPFSARTGALRTLLSFGAWITVSNLISPLLDQLDRLLLGSWAGISSVGFYTPPQEAVLRMRVLPTALAGALFPEFSAQADAARSRAYYAIALRFLALVLAPFTLGLVLLGPDLLGVWLGPEFARMGGLALRFLAVGAFANALAYVPFTFLHGINRPDLPAKFHVLELPLFLIVAAALIPRFGVAGAGAAWAVRATADAALLLRAAAVRGASLSSGRSVATWVWAVAFSACLTVGFVPSWPELGLSPRVILTLVGGTLLLGSGWIALLSPERRASVRAALQRFEPAG